MDAEIVGLFDINVSKVDNTIFISNKKVNDPGCVGSFALYADETGRIKSAGIALTYDSDLCLLASPAIITTNLTSVNIETNNIVSDKIKINDILVGANIDVTNIATEILTVNHITTEILTVNHYIDIDSISVNSAFNKCLFFLDNDHDSFAKIHYTDISGHALALLTKKPDGTDGCALTIDGSQRVRILDGVLNIKHKRIIKSPKGNQGDHAGDIAINDNYIYYCKQNFNGITNIWVRTKFNETDW